MLTEITRHLSDYYGHQKQSYINYESRQLRKIYTLEYCDDEGKLERVGLRSEYGGLEIDDAYHSRHYKEDELGFESMDGIAIETYIRYLFNPKICDVKLWEQIYEGNELIQERWFEFPSTFCHEIARVIAKDVTESRDNLQKQVDPLVKEIETFNEFLKELNSEHIYKEWKEKREVQKC